MSPNVVLTLALAGFAGADAQQRLLPVPAISQLLHAGQSLLQQQSLRRLEQVSSAECMKWHCPGAASKFMIIQTSLGSELNDTSHMGDAVASMYRKFCDAEADFMCVVESCSNASTEASIGPDPVEVAGQLECLCDACPAMQRGMGNLATVIQMTAAMFAGSSGSDHDVNTMIDELCAMVEGIECVIAHSKCQSVQKHIGVLPKSLQQMKPLCSRSVSALDALNCTQSCPRPPPSTCVEFERMAKGCASGCEGATLTFLASTVGSGCEHSRATQVDKAWLANYGLRLLVVLLATLYW